MNLETRQQMFGNVERKMRAIRRRMNREAREKCAELMAKRQERLERERNSPNAMLELFGEPISAYTSGQAVEDGILIRNPSPEFSECSLITTNLWEYIKDVCKDALMTEPLEFLNCIMQQARYIYSRGLFQGDNDRDFFVIKDKNGFKAVWLVRNEHNKLTAMLKEDY